MGELVYKHQNNLLPRIYDSNFSNISDVHQYHTRSRKNQDVFIPRPRTNYGKFKKQPVTIFKLYFCSFCCLYSKRLVKNVPFALISISKTRLTNFLPSQHKKEEHSILKRRIVKSSTRERDSYSAPRKFLIQQELLDMLDFKIACLLNIGGGAGGQDRTAPACVRGANQTAEFFP